ncbi:MAG: metal-dependent hydrolase [Microthrixaceae bacterium]
MTRSVPTRRMSFEESLRDVPRHFAQDGDLLGSHLTAALSSAFPDGEDFFVRSVRHFRSEITDPTFKEQVAGFIGQESVHGREHRAFNDRLAELGYPTKLYERIVFRVLAFRSKVAPAKANLAATAALEHFTAVLAEHILTSEQTRDRLGHPAVRDLFVWHALEESEHKAVAFDVYRAVGGTERMRIWTMKAIRVGFILAATAAVAGSLAGDSATYRPGALRTSWKRFKASPMISKDMWAALKEYDRPGFHPDDRDTDELLEHWRAELFGPDGSLNNLLAGAAA